MNEYSNRRIIIVGIFVFIGLLFFIIGILVVGDLHKTFDKKVEVVAFFDDVAGLQKGNNVWLSGVKVGTISSIEFSGKSKVEVKIQIDAKAKPYIPVDSKVKVSSDGFIGNKILVIYGGSSETASVSEGDVLNVEKTFSSEDMLNTLQQNNNNLLAITNDIRKISGQLASGEGTLGKMLYDKTLYANIQNAASSLQVATRKAQELTNSLAEYTANFNKEGTLANGLVNDTTVFNSVKASISKLIQIADTASVVISNIKRDGTNPNSPIGVLLHDEQSGASLKETIKNLESSSVKLGEDLEALQHSPFLKRYFKNKVNNTLKNYSYDK
jgi:phospholipid/cholesterol/gamma-HCH transport system substrate-binding protein